MKSSIQFSTIRSWLYITFLMVLFCLSGCSKVGSVIPVDQRMEISEAGQVNEIYNYRGLTVMYTYILQNGNLQLSGRTSIPGRVDSFDLRVLFLDSSGKVLEQKLLYSIGYRQGWWKGGPFFTKTFQVPPETAGLSFTYSFTPHRGRR